MASPAAVARLRELAPAPGAELSAAGAAALAECCTGLLRPGGGDAEAAHAALEALCAAGGGDAMRRHADGLAPLVVGRLGDGDVAVREAARRFLVLLMEMKETNAIKENTEPNSFLPDNQHDHCMTIEKESSDASQVRKSSKEKISIRDVSLLAGEGDTTKIPVEPIKVFSEKDLLREIEKVVSTLQADNEWSIRISAMQRVEGLVLGGAADYSAFPMLLKQLVTPLITQLLDRRSSVVKQACHLLNFLSKELLRDFEPCAELLIPVLLKNVVITILVIAESADNCIKEMLRNCKVARILPRIIEFAKNDRSAVLRARCCEYAILMLEYWVDTPEIQRSADLYEDLIKCCIADATSEVRSSARACYRMFSRTWPERSHQLFSSFEPSRQKLINDEDAETHQRHLPSDERVKLRQPQPSSCIPAVMDKVVKVDSGTSFSSVDLQPLQKPYLQYDDTTSKGPTEGSKDDTSAIGSSFEDRSTLGKEGNTATDTDNCDSDNSAGVNSSCCDPPSATPLVTEPPSEMSLPDAIVVTIVQDKAECRPNIEHISSQQLRAPEDPSELTSLPPTIDLKGSGNLLMQSPVKVSSGACSGGKQGPQLVGKHCFSTPNKSAVSKEPRNSYTPNFRRPLLSKQMTNWFYASTRSDLDEKKLILGEMISNMDVPSSLTEALSLGLNPRSDWMMRVYAFNFLRQCLLERGPKGIQEVAQNFEKVMRLVCRYLYDPHHKVAQAGLSSLAEIMPAFKKPFEHYLDKTLPHIFSRLNDPKELIKRQCSAILTLASEIYSIDSLLPALLRSLDEQKSPKSKMAVLEFANASFVKCTVNSESYSSSSFLKPWLGKLALLFKDKNNKLKEVAVVGFSSIYSHYDPALMLSFLVSLSMEEQKRLRWAVKQLIPTIESDLEEFLQQRRHKQKAPSFDPFTAKSPLHPAYQSAKSPLHPSYQSAKSPLHPSYQSAKSPLHPAYQSNSVKADDLFSSALQCLPNIFLESESTTESYGHKAEMMDKKSSTMRSSNGLPRRSDCSVISDNTGQSAGRDARNMKKNNCQDHENLHQMSSSLLEMLDDPDEPTRELALSLLVEILEKQRKAMENCIETLIVKLLHATKDAALKVVNQAHICLTTVVTQFDPLRCLGAIASQLACQDEKILIISINSLSKLVIRLSQENLMAHLSTFLPALLDAFENHSPYVRKAVMVCLVDTYLKLGPAFLPYLEGLDSAQLQLVTTYANRLSQARFIAVDG
ncbi:CLIP-associated protein-like isoform X2 [Phragmites australis]|uniref:CLIP-associated protein-like isoform X2 n=1 Tax=Phragmites australis TaxID=29695 RepID=UPI002D785D8A|nr:CLIP-associated protein-like isoform X2 [Phragmites australis]